MKPPSPLHAPNKGPLKQPLLLRPKTAPKQLISHPQRRWRFQTHTGTSEQRRWRFQTHTGTSEQRRRWFQTTASPRLQGLAAARASDDDTTASQISHVIYRGHFSRCPKNVAIPTTQIQCLNQSSRNYVRNCWLTAIAGNQGNAPSRRAEPLIEARGADGSRAAHGAARPQGRARLPENPRVHKQQPAPHSNT